MLPTYGPQVYRVRELDAEIGAESTLGPVLFRWPRDVFVTWLLLLPESGERADMARLRLRIQDETYADLIGDGLAGVDAPALELCGQVPLGILPGIVMQRPFVLQRPVIGGDLWRITLENTKDEPQRAELLFGFEEPRR